jgi:oxygen-independent coproporphyrinogen-3 oxidase
MYEDLSYSDNLEEYIMLRLRLTDGFSLSEFKEKFGYDILEKNDKIKLMKNNNLINIDNDRLYLTEKGINVCDSIILQLI